MFYFSRFIFMCAEAGITYTAHIVRFHPVIHTVVIHPEVAWQLKAVRGWFSVYRIQKRLPDVFDIAPLPGGVASATFYF